MGKTQILLLAVVGIAVIGLFNLGSNMQNHQNLMFKIWKEKNAKIYDQKQNSYRLQVWLQNLAFVKQHNARYDAGLQTYEVEMNSFADLTSQQFGAKYLGLQKVQTTDKCTGKQAPSDKLPTEIDWQAKGKVTAVKNQGQCGSCWAFSTTGSLEGAYAITKNQQASFSEQQLVDCSTSYKNNGCNGGWMDSAFYYVKDNGITLQSKYPYKGVDAKCNYNPTQDKAWTISDCTDVQVNKQLALRAAVAQQPVSVAIQANHMSFQLYRKGVYTGLCGTKLDHGVLAVGYGALDGKDYWKVKNSWGSGWGSSGYIMIERTGDGKGKCGIYEAASFPIA